MSFFLVLKLQHPNLGLKIVLYMVYVRIYIFEYKKLNKTRCFVLYFLQVCYHSSVNFSK